MESLQKILHYLANHECTERMQLNCLFCDRERLKDIVCERGQTYADVISTRLAMAVNLWAE